MFVRFPALRNPRRNPAKVPVQLLTRSTLDAVGQAYPDQIRVPKRNPDAAVLRDFMLDAGIETLPGMPAIERGSTLHRWIVWDAALSAESVPQKPMGTVAIHRAKSWVADPSPSHAEKAHVAAWDCMRGPHTRAAIAAHYAASAPMSAASYAPRDSAYNAKRSVGPESTAVRAGDAANIRVRVLAALYAVGALPEPPKLDSRQRPDPSYRTYPELMAELRWLGPASVVKLALDGDTRQCGEAAHTVAQYLIERGFAAREDTGAGKYCSHFDLAVFTADTGWITVDPTYVQFSLPNSLDHARRIAERKLGIDVASLSRPNKDALFARVFEPTVAWSVDAMRDPTIAFEIGQKTERVDSIPKAPSASEPPDEWRGGTSWREVWQKYRTIAEDIAKTGTSDGLEHYDLTYWFRQLAGRIRDKRISAP